MNESYHIGNRVGLQFYLKCSIPNWFGAGDRVRKCCAIPILVLNSFRFTSACSSQLCASGLAARQCSTCWRWSQPILRGAVGHLQPVVATVQHRQFCTVAGGKRALRLLKWPAAGRHFRRDDHGGFLGKVNCGVYAKASITTKRVKATAPNTKPRNAVFKAPARICIAASNANISQSATASQPRPFIQSEQAEPSRSADQRLSRSVGPCTCCARIPNWPAPPRSAWRQLRGLADMRHIAPARSCRI